MRIAAAALFSTALAFPLLQDPAAGEPPLRLGVEIDGTTHTLVDGQEVQIELGGKPTRVKVVVTPTRRLEAGGIAFEYPRGMSFEHVVRDELGMWNLHSTPVAVYVHRHRLPGAADIAKATLASMLRQTDPKAAPAVEWQVSLGGKMHSGVHGKVDVVDGAAKREFFAVGLPVGTGSVVLMVRHTIDGDGASKDELQRVLDLLATTFQVTAK